ncbi:MAG: GNAT family N-acetyltransferase [Myxococcales bacterium]|nr:GNAT family N-acetyltransferase [Myxococcales bacterium]
MRAWDLRDAPLAQEAIEGSRKHLAAMGWAHAWTDVDAALQHIRGFRAVFDSDEDFFYVVLDPQEKKVVGGTGLHTREGDEGFEIGYWIREDHARQGYGTEVSAALTRAAFEVCAVDRVVVRCSPYNLASAAIPRKLGFHHEATLRRRLREANGDMRDTMVWTMWASTYEESPAARVAVRGFDGLGRPILPRL